MIEATPKGQMKKKIKKKLELAKVAEPPILQIGGGRTMLMGVVLLAIGDGSIHP